MTSEALYLILPPTSWYLWGLGGAGFKWARRFGYPLVLWLALRGYGIAPTLAGWMALQTSLVAHLGYGDTGRQRKRVGIAFAYGMTVLWISLDWWPLALLLAGWWLTFFKLTRTWNDWTHRLTEGLIGFGHALACVWVVTH